MVYYKYLQVIGIVGLLFLYSVNGFAQKATMPNNMEKHTHIVFAGSQKALTTHIKYYQAITHQQVPNFADHSLRIQRLPFAKITNIQGYTQLNNKKIPANIQQPQSSKQQDHVFYDDTQAQQINFAQVSAGSQTVLQYEEEYNEPHLPLRLYLQDNYLMKNWTVVVNFPPTVEIAYQLINVKDSTISFQRKSYPTYQQYIFTAKNLSVLADDIEKTHSPQLLIYVKSIEKQAVLGTVKNLYDWYYSISKNTLYKNSKTIKNLSDSLTQNITNDSLKAVKLLEWVQKKIRYIAFEQSWGGFIPRTPQETYQKRYGDCKDMANLLATLARSIGLEAYFAWIGTRQLPYSYTTTPLPLTDNHAIVVFKYHQKNYFVDATNPYAIFDLPTYYIQGKEALLSIDSINYEIVQVPVVAKEKNIQIDSLYLTIKDNQLLCVGKSVFGGLRAIQLKEQRKLQQKQWFQELEKQKPIQWSDSATYITAHYQLTLSNNLTKIGNDVYIPLLPCVPKKLVDNFLQIPIIYFPNFLYIYKQVVTLELPANYQIETIPSPQSYLGDDNAFSWHCTQLAPNLLTVRFTVFCNKFLDTSSEKEQFFLFNKVLLAMQQQYAIIIQE